MLAARLQAVFTVRLAALSAATLHTLAVLAAGDASACDPAPTEERLLPAGFRGSPILYGAARWRWTRAASRGRDAEGAAETR